MGLFHWYVQKDEFLITPVPGPSSLDQPLTLVTKIKKISCIARQYHIDIAIEMIFTGASPLFRGASKINFALDMARIYKWYF